MMRFDEFVDNMELTIKSLFFSKNILAQVEICEIKKSTDQYVGLAVKLPGERIAPVYNLSAAYEDYLKGRDVKDILEDAMHVILDTAPNYDVEKLLDYEESKKKFFIKVCNAEKRADYLKGVPHTLVDDLAITYHIMLSNKAGEIASVCINNRLLEHYGVSLEKLHKDATENAAKILPTKVTDFNDIPAIAEMEEVLRGEEWNENEIPCPFDMVVTNELGIAGAATLFYPDTLDQLAEKYGGSFYVLPSSTEEVLTVCDCGVDEIPEMNSMVREVNSRCVEENQQLGSEVYHYDADDRIFERGTKYAERKQQKIQELESGREVTFVLRVMKAKAQKMNKKTKNNEQYKGNDNLSL